MGKPTSLEIYATPTGVNDPPADLADLEQVANSRRPTVRSCSVRSRRPEVGTWSSGSPACPRSRGVSEERSPRSRSVRDHFAVRAHRCRTAGCSPARRPGGLRSALRPSSRPTLGGVLTHGRSSRRRRGCPSGRNDLGVPRSRPLPWRCASDHLVAPDRGQRLPGSAAAQQGSCCRCAPRRP